MARPRNRPDAVNSAYFEGVTPLWVAPGRAPIPERYHAASFSLADWAGPDWPDNDASGFFPLRHYLIGACEKWQTHNWQADWDLIAARKRDAKHRQTLAKATRAFRQAIGSSSFRRAERDLGVSIATALCPSAKLEMTYEDGCSAVVSALRDFEKQSLRPDRFPVRFGPLLYDTFPTRLPKREIAVALVLADFVKRRTFISPSAVSFVLARQISSLNSSIPCFSKLVAISWMLRGRMSCLAACEV